MSEGTVKLCDHENVKGSLNTWRDPEQHIHFSWCARCGALKKPLGEKISKVPEWVLPRNSPEAQERTLTDLKGMLANVQSAYGGYKQAVQDVLHVVAKELAPKKYGD